MLFALSGGRPFPSTAIIVVELCLFRRSATILAHDCLGGDQRGPCIWIRKDETRGLRAECEIEFELSLTMGLMSSLNSKLKLLLSVNPTLMLAFDVAWHSD